MPKIYPVIHVKDEKEALNNIHISVDAGADGVFLINHEIYPEELLYTSCLINEEFPGLWIGINRLGIPAIDSFDCLPGFIKGVWVDNSEIFGTCSKTQAEKINEKRVKWGGIYFGGVAFKYQKQPIDIVKATAVVSKYVDVVTTSGDATGKPPDEGKISIMKKTLGSQGLALASGVDINNVDRYLPYVDHFLVSTSISDSFYELNERLTFNLIKKVKLYSKPI